MRNSLLHSQKIYDPNDSALLSEQEHCMECLYDYNATRPSEKEKRTQLLHTMLAECGKGCWIEPPFHANWGGRHLHLGKPAKVCQEEKSENSNQNNCCRVQLSIRQL